MFNQSSVYAVEKRDGHKCARYRITNSRGKVPMRGDVLQGCISMQEQTKGNDGLKLASFPIAKGSAISHKSPAIRPGSRIWGSTASYLKLNATRGKALLEKSWLVLSGTRSGPYPAFSLKKSDMSIIKRITKVPPRHAPQ